MKLDAQFVQIVKEPITKAFYELAEPDDIWENMTNRQAIEYAWDHISSQDHAAEMALRDAIKTHGYKKVLNYLAKHVAL